jgi:hypothetical protein
MVFLLRLRRLLLNSREHWKSMSEGDIEDSMERGKWKMLFACAFIPFDSTLRLA